MGRVYVNLYGAIFRGINCESPEEDTRAMNKNYMQKLLYTRNGRANFIYRGRAITTITLTFYCVIHSPRIHAHDKKRKFNRILTSILLLRIPPSAALSIFFFFAAESFLRKIHVNEI